MPVTSVSGMADSYAGFFQGKRDVTVAQPQSPAQCRQSPGPMSAGSLPNTTVIAAECVPTVAAPATL
ncbi:MAG: hypothetical protein IBX69_11445 [Anaerolineales bacterium]|nr:hypothetical protein [Anaerolineales bacterium]